MKVQVTGGYVGEVRCWAADTESSTLSSAGLKLALVPVGVARPAKDSPDWKTPSTIEYRDAGTDGVLTARALMTLNVAASQGVGKYRLWVLVSASPLFVPMPLGDEIIELV